MIRIFLLLIVCLLTLSCGGAFKPKKVDTREVSTNAQERARKNIETGRGTSLQGLIKATGAERSAPSVDGPTS